MAQAQTSAAKQTSKHDDLAMQFVDLGFDAAAATANDYQPIAGEFMHIQPIGRDAQEAYNDLERLKQGNLLTEYHAKLLTRTGTVTIDQPGQ